MTSHCSWDKTQTLYHNLEDIQGQVSPWTTQSLTFQFEEILLILPSKHTQDQAILTTFSALTLFWTTISFLENDNCLQAGLSSTLACYSQFLHSSPSMFQKESCHLTPLLKLLQWKSSNRIKSKVSINGLLGPPGSSLVPSSLYFPPLLPSSFSLLVLFILAFWCFPSPSKHFCLWVFALAIPLPWNILLQDLCWTNSLTFKSLLHCQSLARPTLNTIL